MSEAIKRIIDAVTDKVLSHRPVDKGLAVRKKRRKIQRQKKSEKRLQISDEK